MRRGKSQALLACHIACSCYDSKWRDVLPACPASRGWDGKMQTRAFSGSPGGERYCVDLPLRRCAPQVCMLRSHSVLEPSRPTLAQGKPPVDSKDCERSSPASAPGVYMTSRRLRTRPLGVVPSARSHHPPRRAVALARSDVCKGEASRFTAQARRALHARAAPREGEREACGVTEWARLGWLCARRRGRG